MKFIVAAAWLLLGSAVALPPPPPLEEGQILKATLAEHTATIARLEALVATLVAKVAGLEATGGGYDSGRPSVVAGSWATAARQAPEEAAVNGGGASGAGARRLTSSGSSAPPQQTRIDRSRVETATANVTDIFIHGALYFRGVAWDPFASVAPTPAPVTKFLLHSAVGADGHVPISEAAFKAHVEALWDANPFGTCRSPWFIQDVRGASTGALYLDSRVCFSCSFATWSGGHVGDGPAALASAAHWRVVVPSLGVNLVANGQLVRADMYREANAYPGQYWGLHYKRTHSGEHFDHWDGAGTTVTFVGYACLNSADCGYQGANQAALGAMHRRVYYGFD